MLDHGKVDFDAMPWEILSPKSRQKRVVLNGRVLRMLEFDDGFMESEWCRRTHLGYVVAGELQVLFADSATTWRTGDALVLEGGDEGRHRASVVRGPVRLFLIESV
jgi:hypothetical protein